MTETRGSEPASGKGRATIQYVTQSRENGQMFATTPFRRVDRSGSHFGNRIRVLVERTSMPDSLSRFSTSVGETQLRIGFDGLSRSRSAIPSKGRHVGLYEL